MNTYVNSTTGLTYRVNIHEPKYIKEMILQGIEAGWNGKNKIGERNGIDYLNIFAPYNSIKCQRSH